MDPTGLLPGAGNLVFTLAAFVVALSVIVAVHEYGHYIVGKWSGIHADVFSIGFGPVLFSRVDANGTRWQVAALPFGGYVKFAGDSSAASGKDAEMISEMTPAEARRTMHGAPLWARAATVAAGPVFNFALSIAVFAFVLTIRGIASEPLTVGEVYAVPGEAGGLRAGDEILAIGGEPAPEPSGLTAFIDGLPVTESVDYRVRRDGVETTVAGPYPFPARVAGVSPQSAAIAAGLRRGDVITGVDGTPIAAFEALRTAVAESDGATLTLDVWRDGDTRQVELTPRRTDLPVEGGFETRYLIGVSGGLLFDPATRTPGPFAALGHGVNQTLFVITSSLSGLYHMAVGAISTCNLSGPIGIAETSGAVASQGWLSFVGFIAVLSTAVGMLNLFPIPVLDGGHLVFHAYEAVTGRPPSDGALRVLMGVGLTLMLALMLFAVGNDLFCP